MEMDTETESVDSVTSTVKEDFARLLKSRPRGVRFGEIAGGLAFVQEHLDGRKWNDCQLCVS
jgi:hypothetical protein